MAFTPALDVAETGNTKFTSGKPVMAPATNAAVTIAAKLFHMTIPLLQPLSFLFVADIRARVQIGFRACLHLRVSA